MENSDEGKGRVKSMIRQYRQDLDWTQSELGKRLGYKYGNFIGMVETGKAEFPVDKWELYADTLGIPKHTFLKALFEDYFRDMLPYVTIHPNKFE